jgi:hypothetical protein
VLFGHFTASGQRLGNLDLASRQATYHDADDFDTGMRPMVTPRDIVFLATDHQSLGLLDSGGARRTLLTLPDSLELDGYVVNPAGDSAAVIVITPHARQLAVSPLDAWQPRWLHEFAAAEYSRYVSWHRSGWIHFWLWKAGEDTPALWQVRPGGGEAVRQRALPTACNTSQIDIAVAADRGTCRGEDIRSDIWLVNLPGVTR